MNREKYLEMRNNGITSIQLLFEYYTNKNGLIKDISNFAKYFKMSLEYQNYNFKELYNHYYIEYNVHVLYDKEGKIVNYY